MAERKWGMVGAFFHAEPGLKLLADLYEIHGENLKEFLIVERLADTDKVIPREYIPTSDDPDPFKRRMEDDESIRICQQQLAAQRDLPNLLKTPILDKYSYLAFQAKQHVAPRLWVPEPLVYQIAKPFSDVWREVRNACTDQEIKDAVDFIATFGPRDDLAMLEPVRRMLSSQFRSIPILLRGCARPTMDWDAFFNAKGIYLIIGGDVSDIAFRLHVSAVFQHLAARKRKEKIYKNLRFLRDESNNAKLIGEFESAAWSTLRTFRMFTTDIIQSWDFPTPEIGRNARQNCNLYFFKQGDFESAKIAAQSMLASIDEYAAHHEDEIRRQVHDGFDEIERKTTTTRPDGGVSESVSPQLIPRYREITDKRTTYKTGEHQILFKAQEIQELDVGEYFAREDGGEPHKEKAELCPEPWSFGGDPEYGIDPLWKEKALECIQMLKQLPMYITPTQIKWVPAVPPASSTPTSTATLRKRAMRKRKKNSKKTP